MSISVDKCLLICYNYFNEYKKYMFINNKLILEDKTMDRKTCADCLFYGESFRWQSGDYCNKHEKHVEYDTPACSGFTDNSHDCCYDCDNGKDMGLTFFCKAQKKTIKNPASFYCYRFTD